MGFTRLKNQAFSKSSRGLFVLPLLVAAGTPWFVASNWLQSQQCQYLQISDSDPLVPSSNLLLWPSPSTFLLLSPTWIIQKELPILRSLVPSTKSLCTVSIHRSWRWGPGHLWEDMILSTTYLNKAVTKTNKNSPCRMWPARRARTGDLPKNPTAEEALKSPVLRQLVGTERVLALASNLGGNGAREQ